MLFCTERSQKTKHRKKRRKAGRPIGAAPPVLCFTPWIAGAQCAPLRRARAARRRRGALHRLSSRALKPEELDGGLTETVLAYDGIAVVVHPDNPVADLDVETIAKVYTGEIANWKDVGGTDAEIVLIRRVAGTGR